MVIECDAHTVKTTWPVVPSTGSGSDEGFVGIETNKNAVYKDHLGKIWFGTIKGAICYNPHAERINKTPPIAHILEVKFAGEDTTNEYHKFQYHQEQFNPIPKNLILPYQFNNISFKIKGINLSIPHKVKYQWKLEGYNKEWSEPSQQEIINYTNLPYGKYRFLVKACNENDIWTKTPVAFEFKIVTPFWKKNWFYLIVFLSAFGLLYLISQWRVNRLQRAKKELENQVLLRTKELQKEKELVESKNKEIETEEHMK